jgi:antitoxin PrlF
MRPSMSEIRGRCICFGDQRQDIGDAALVSRKAVSHTHGMNRQTRLPCAFSKVSVKSQTVIPREVRERLRLKPGDTLRYRMTEDGVLLDKAPANEADDPFATFSEWSTEADEKAYGDL